MGDHEFSCTNGQNTTTEALEIVTQCVAMARGPTHEVKSRKLVFFRHTDKEDMIQELETLKGAVLDQTYHFQLHKIQLVSLCDQHKVAGEAMQLQNLSHLLDDIFYIKICTH